MITDWIQVCSTSPKHRYRDDGVIETADGAPSTLSGARLDALRSIWSRYGELIATHAALNELAPSWVLALLWYESGGNPRALSPAGAAGLMQVMPGTAKSFAGRAVSTEELFEPGFAIELGCRIMRYQAQRYGFDLPVIAAAYNAGSKRCAASAQCNAKIDGKWQRDGTSAPTSWGLIEDCTRGVGSAYVRRIVGASNDAITAGICSGIPPVTPSDRPNTGSGATAPPSSGGQHTPIVRESSSLGVGPVAAAIAAVAILVGIARARR